MYSGTSLLQTTAGPHEVSWLKRCPHFRGCSVHFSLSIYKYLKDRFNYEYLILWFGYPSQFAGTNNCGIEKKNQPHPLIGASLSEPHINGSALCQLYVYNVWYNCHIPYLCCSNSANCKFTLVLSDHVTAQLHAIQIILQTSKTKSLNVRRQSESAEQLRGATKMEKTELDVLLRLLNKGSLSLQWRHDLLNAESA